MSKAQGALEYLLLIGGAIVVAAVVVTLVLNVSSTGGGGAKTAAYQLQVKQLMTTKNIEGYWKFDEGSGQYAYGQILGRDLSNTQNQPPWQQGKFGSSINCSQSYYHFGPTNGNNRPALGSDWTISAWFNYPINGSQPSSGFNVLIHTQLGTPSNVAPIAVNYASKHLGARNITTGAFIDSGFDMSTLGAGWHHIAASGSGTSTSFYIDGNPAGSPITFKPTGQIVQACSTNNGDSQWANAIDELIIFNRALGANEIRGLAIG